MPPTRTFSAAISWLRVSSVRGAKTRRERVRGHVYGRCSICQIISLPTRTASEACWDISKAKPTSTRRTREICASGWVNPPLIAMTIMWYPPEGQGLHRGARGIRDQEQFAPLVPRISHLVMAIVVSQEGRPAVASRAVNEIKDPLRPEPTRGSRDMFVPHLGELGHRVRRQPPRRMPQRKLLNQSHARSSSIWITTRFTS